MRLALALALFAAPSVAIASPEFCLAAKNRGDEAQWTFWANHLLTKKNGTSRNQIDDAAQCLDDFPGGPYVERNGHFMTEEQAAKQDANDAAQKVAEEAATRAKDEAARRAADIIEAADQRMAEQQLAVTQRLVDGCAAMFDRDPDQTITNALCFDVFMKRGLPN